MSLNPFFFRARLQHIIYEADVIHYCLNPFFFRARLQLRAYEIAEIVAVLIPFSSGLGCSVKEMNRADTLLS